MSEPQPSLPESIPLTEEIQTAILRYLERVIQIGQHRFWTSEVEVLRIDIATAVLRSIGLFDPPRWRALEEDDQAPIERRRRSRVTLPFIVRAKVMARDGFRCCECQSVLSLTIDHIVPVSKGGVDDESNLRTLCGTCNSRKGARLDP